MPDRDDRDKQAQARRPGAGSPNAASTNPPAAAAGEGEEVLTDAEVLEMIEKLQQRVKDIGIAQNRAHEQLESIANQASGAPASPPGPSRKAPKGVPSWMQQSGVAEPAGDDSAAPPPAGAARAQPPPAPAPPAPPPVTTGSDAAADAADPLEADKRLQSARTRIEELAAEIERCRQELAVKDRQIELASRQLDEMQAELDKAQAVDPQEHETALKNIEKLKAALAQRDEAIEQYEKKLEQAIAAGSGAAADPMIERQRRQIERLTAQLEASRAETHGEEIRARDARIAELEGALAVAQSAAQEAAESPAKSKGRPGTDEQVMVLEAERERFRRAAERATLEAEEARRALQEHLASAPAGAGPGPGTAGPQQERIRQLEEELREARAEAVAARADRTQQRVTDSQAMRDQKQRIAEAHEALKKAEAVMIRRWARQQAVVVWGWLAAIAAVCAVGSALAANRFFPATIAASVEVGVRTRSAQPLQPDAATEWARWHTELLGRQTFHAVVARRMAERRLHGYDDPRSVGRVIKERLRVSVEKPGVMTLTLAGTDMDEVTAVLGVIASTLATESLSAAEMRPDGASAVVRGDVSPGTVPLRDRRLIAGAGIFAISLLLGAIGVLRIYRWLLRTKGTLAENNIFFDPGSLSGRAARAA